MRRRIRMLGAASVIAGLAMIAACSGAQTSDLTTPGAGGGGGGGASGGGGEGGGHGAGGGGGGNSAGGGGHPGGGGGGGGGVAGGGGGAGGGVVGLDAGDDGFDGNIGTPDPGIACGNSECPPGPTVCCRTGDFTTGFSYACTPTGDCPSTNVGTLAIPCDDQQDCVTAGAKAGDVCCVSADTSGNATEVTCASPAECTQALGRTWVCDPSVPNACPNPLACVPSTQTLPGYDICR